jgi:hypothetical protein
MEIPHLYNLIWTMKPDTINGREEKATKRGWAPARDSNKWTHQKPHAHKPDVITSGEGGDQGYVGA